MPRAVSRVAIASSFVLAALTLSHCGDAADRAASTAPMICTPGTGYTCVRGSCNGFQQCKADGSGWDQIAD
jgi:hypothetical protein